VECPGCGFENREGKRFCVGCGTPLAVRCPGCSCEVDPGEKFCGECGTPLTVGAAPVADPATTPAAVRKTVTVLFADLSGSTGFGERNDAEIARQVLARYHALLQDVIEAHAGTVAKFMGDGVMATFGIPEVAEDDARRAVAAGAAMQQRFHEFAADVERRHGETLALRVGINTGEVVIGEGDADLIGDALNVAARLEKECRPGHVLVGEETWRLTRADVGYEALGEVIVAGRAQPVAIYEVAADVDAAPEVVAPFVGRNREMQRLVGVFDDARQSGAARLTTVLGSPGVGKTRLARELCSHLAEHRDAQRVELRCDRAGEATFAPVAQLIRDASGITEDLEPDAARAAIGALLPEAESDHTRVVDVLAGLVGVGPARSVEETFWGVRRLVEATAATRPLVVVIDDIQWAEPLLLDLIEHLAEWVADAPVLLVVLARPELREVRPSLAEPARPVSAVVVLDGLDASATEALAAGLLGTGRLPAGLVERLPDSTDGNPLFVRELVRMLVDDRVIRRRADGEWELTIDAEAVDVPPTIQSLLGARVERLPAAERELLEHASVVGAEFSLGALRDLVGERVPIISLLETMRRKELVEPTGTYRGDEPVHRFHHVLIRDAAYRRLLKTTRAELHERVAVWTDATAADLVGEHEAATAFHYEQAYRYRTELGDPDGHAADLGRRAAELLTTAAQRALGRDDLASAGGLSARALSLLPEADAAARADLLQMACECLLASGDGGAAKPLVEELGRTTADDPRLAAWAQCYAAQLVGLTDPGGLVAADAQAQAAAEALTELGDGSGQAKAHQVRAGLLARLGRVGDCELELDLALAAARAADDRRRVTAVLGAAPDAALFGPSPVARAGGRCLDVVRLLRITTASPAVEAASNRCQAVLEALRGRFDVSRSMLASARAALEELGLRHGLAQTELFAGMVEMIAGDPHAAIPPLRAAFAGLGALGVGADAGSAAALLSRALLVDGQVDEADEMATASEQLAGQNLKTAIGWRVARAEVLATRNDLAGAVELTGEAVEIAAGTDLVIDHADACVALAALRARAGDAAGARAARADAKRLYEQKGATVPAERLDEPEVVAPARSRVPARRPAATAAVPSAENTASRVLARYEQLVSDGRYDESAALYAEDLVATDRRSGVSVPPLGPVELQEGVRLTFDLFDGFDSANLAVRGERLVLSKLALRTHDGLEVPFLQLFEIDEADRIRSTTHFDPGALSDAIEELDARYIAGEGAEHADLVAANAASFHVVGVSDPGGRAERVEAFAAEDSGAAAARFEKLSRGGEDPPPIENAQTRNVDRIFDLATASRWDEAADRFVPNFVRVDHRSGVADATTTDRDEYLAAFRAAFDVGFVSAVVQHLAVRGDRLGLMRSTFTSDSGSEMVILSVGEIDESGRASSLALYDPDDLETAVADLEERYLTGEGVEHADVARAAARVNEAFERDPESLPALCAPDFALDDHRQLYYGSGDVEYLVRIRRASSDEHVAATVTVNRRLLVQGRALLTLQDLRREDPDGAVYQWTYCILAAFDASMRLQRLEWFDVDNWDVALARFDAAAARPSDSRHPRMENAASLAGQRVLDRTAAGLYDEAAALFRPDFQRIDRRRTVAAPPVTSAAEYLESIRSILEQFDTITTEPVAVRGESLYLSRSVFARDGFETVFWAPTELDAEGLLRRIVNYDEVDLAAALAELDEWYAEGEGSEHAYMIRRAGDFVRSMGALDGAATLALVHPDVRWTDHRPLGFGTAGFEGVRGVLEARAHDTAEDRSYFRDFAVRGSTTMGHFWSAGIGPDGDGAVLYEFHWVARWVAGEMHDIDWYDLDDVDAARARFEELAAAPPRADLDNACVRVCERGEWLAEFGFVAEAVDTIAPEIVAIDHRSGTGKGLRIEGRDPYLENQIAVRRLFPPGPSSEWLAVRGERLALSRLTWTSASGFEAVHLATFEIDDDGRLCCNDQYDVDDLATAVAALDARYVAGEGSEHALWLAGVTEGFSDLAAEHPDGVPDDFVFVDHRFGGAELDGEGYTAWQRSYPGIERSVLVQRIDVGDATALATVRYRGLDESGGEFDWSFHSVLLLGADRDVARVEIWDTDGWDAAHARFDDLSAESVDSRTPRIENAATRASRRVIDLTAAGRYDEASALFLPEFERYDRRHTVAAPPTATAAEYMDAARATLEQFDTLTIEPIAVRGDRLHLSRTVLATATGFETVFWQVAELDADGLIAQIVNFDEDDLATAVAELDARSIDLVGPVPCPGEARLLAGVQALNRRDWDGFRAFHPDFVAIDHSPLGFPPTDAEGFLRDQMQTMAALVPDFVVVLRKILAVGRAALALGTTLGTTAEGNEYRWDFVQVTLFDAEGRLQQRDLYSETQWAEALARFDELVSESTADPRHPRAENAGTRLADEVARLVAENRLDEAELLFAEDYVRIDRRSGVAAPDVQGGRAFLEAYRGFFDVGFDVLSNEGVAVRGERLYLVRVPVRTGDGRELVFLHVAELDEYGRAIAGINFDEDELLAALEELDARYLASGVATDAEIALLPGAAALNRRDYDALTALLSADFVAIDHSPLGFPPADRAGFVHEQMQGLDAMVPDNVRIAVKLLPAGNTVLMVTQVAGTTTDGSAYEWTPVAVSHRGADGLIDRLEFFPVEAWDAALARFDELAAAAPADARALDLENAATRVGRAGLHLVAAGRWDELRAILHSDFERTDRRHTVSAAPVQGVEAYLEALHRIERFDSDRIEPLAVRGDRAAVYRAKFSDAGGNEVSGVIALLLDEADLVLRQANFDDDAKGEIAAIDLIDGWYFEGEGAAHAVELSISQEGQRWYHARDWDAIRAATTDDFELIDHRPLGWPLADADGWVRLMQERVAQVPDMRCAVRKAWVRDTVGLRLVEVLGADPSGGRFSWPTLQISGPLSADGRNRRVEYFALDDLDAAFARFDELAAEPVDAPQAAAAPELTNAAMRYLEAAREFSSTPDRSVDDFAIGWLAEDVKRVDRRTGVSAPDVSGRDAYADVFRAMREAFATFTLDPIAIRGERLALVATVGTSPEGFELPYLILVEVDDAGRAVFLANLDDDLAGATRELEDRYCAGEGAADAYLIRRAGDFMRSLAHIDGRATAALQDPAVELTDHRSLGFGTIGIEEIRGILAARAEQIVQDSSYFRTLEVRGDTAIGWWVETETSSDGTAFEFELFLVAQLVAGRIRHMDWYDLADRAAAHARFEQLADADPRTPTIDNECVRVDVRGMWLLEHDTGLAAAIDLLAPDVAQIDRRRGVAAPDLVGRDARRENLAAVSEVFGQIVAEHVAVRGERLALLHWTIAADSGFTTSGYDLNELDEENRTCRITTFDEDDLLTALEELERRHHDLRGDAHTPVERVFAEQALAANRRDFDAVASFRAAGYELADHSPSGSGRMSSSLMVALHQAMSEQVDMVLFPGRVYSSGHVGLGYFPFRGTTSDGFEGEWKLVTVKILDDAGLVAEEHCFQVEQWHEALALFDERSSATSEATAHAVPVLENAATRLMARYHAVATADIAALPSLVRPEFTHIDHRWGGVAPTAVGRDEFVDHVGIARSAGFVHTRTMTLAIRGECLAVARFEMVSEAGDVVPGLILSEVDANGLGVRNEVFDAGDLARAVELLDRWYLEGEGAELAWMISPPAGAGVLSNRATRGQDAFSEAFAARDWDAMASSYADDVVNDDRRTGVSSGVTVGRAEVLGLVRGLVDVGFAAVTTVPIAIRDDALALVRRTWCQAGGFDLPLLSVVAYDGDGRVTANVMFDSEDLASAHEELERRHLAGPDGLA
jgi:class 3 adenylate cyclase/ketosteroid isomerase-like protein